MSSSLEQVNFVDLLRAQAAAAHDMVEHLRDQNVPEGQRRTAVGVYYLTSLLSTRVFPGETVREAFVSGLKLVDVAEQPAEQLANLYTTSYCHEKFTGLTFAPVGEEPVGIYRGTKSATINTEAFIAGILTKAAKQRRFSF